jgi:signal recognition particle receptor subunit beta
MVLFNYATKELTAKIVYYGPGLCGKTTNLQWIHTKLPIKNKGKMLSLATETDRTLFFDFLPIELGNIRGMRTRMQLYTVPGQVFYNATRRMVLKGADCVVFVADSQEPMLDPNIESLENLAQNLEANEIAPDSIPLLFQYNKRDLPNALPVEILNDRLNPKNLSFVEAVAIRGDGVEQTLKAATSLVFRYLSTKYSGAAAPAVEVIPVTGPQRIQPTDAIRITPPSEPVRPLSTGARRVQRDPTAALTVARDRMAADSGPMTIRVDVAQEPTTLNVAVPANLTTLAPQPSPSTLEVALSGSVDSLDPAQTLEREGEDIGVLQEQLRQSRPAAQVPVSTAEVTVSRAGVDREVMIPVDVSVPAGTTAVNLRVVLNVAIRLDDRT